MPWPAGYVPRYRLDRSSGQACVELSGVKHYLGPHGTSASKLLYDRLVTEWLANGRRSTKVEQPSISVVELASLYLKFADGYYRRDGEPTGAIHSVKATLRYLVEWYGDDLAIDFGPLALKALRRRLVDKNQSRRYVNDHVDRVKRMFKWAVGEQLIPPATHQALASVAGLRRGRTTARETEPVQPVDDEIVDATLPFLPEVVADMVSLQRLTGMRPAEVCILRPCDVDRSKDVWSFRPTVHKTEHHGRDRTIFIGPKAQAILLRYLARDAPAFCFRPCDSEQRRRAERHAARVTPLSCGNRPGKGRRNPKRPAGEMYVTTSYRRAIYRACDKAFPHPELAAKKRKLLDAIEVEELARWQASHRWAPNQLRHAAATEVRREFGLEAAQVVLGHASANVTQVYAERDSEKGREVARRIG